MDERDLIVRRFVEIFGGSAADVRVFHAPGRVNLIGEHIDYNGGRVFPAALTFGTTMAVRRRGDRKLRLASANFELRGEADLDRLAFDPADGWMNYPKGVAFHLMRHGYAIDGCDMLFDGRIPNGAGLSSSASIEVVTGYGLLALSGHSVDTVRLALIAQEAENRFVGVSCGIMDQFASANGKRDHAVLLKCDTLEYRHVPFRGGSYKIVIGNTGVRRELAGSEYNVRRSQCEEAVRHLQAAFPDLKLLCELTPEAYFEHEHLIPDETLRKRARHAVGENARVLEAVNVLEQNDLAAFGKLMTDSHRSLQTLYEVTGKELDAMVEAALAAPGVLGSRMTGAGFGGCTVSLVHEDHVADFIRRVGDAYKTAVGLDAVFYVCGIGDGVREVQG